MMKAGTFANAGKGERRGTGRREENTGFPAKFLRETGILETTIRAVQGQNIVKCPWTWML